MAGRQLGKYELLEEVGQGGMSVVYRGRDTVLGREVAIKVMHPFMAQRADAKQRFSREAMAVAKLSHPNIMEIYDYSGELAAEAYIVMEFIRGQTLTSFASRTPMELPELGLLIIRELALALAHAHDQGIIHRDLKPENVMIRADGQLKLMDFGIAQMIDADTLTTTGALLGSPAHMSPELIEGETCDVRSDIFSLGTIVYWLMTKRLPFTAPTAPALFKRIVDGHFDDPRVHNPLVTNGMMRVLNKLMKRRREERYQTVREFIADVDEQLKQSGIDHPASALASFLREPDATAAELRANVKAGLRSRGDQAAKAGQLSAALAAYDRVLLLDPDDATLREQVLAIGKKQRRQRKLKRAVRLAEVAAAVIVIGSAGSFAAWRVFAPNVTPNDLLGELEPPHPPVFATTVVTPKPAPTGGGGGTPRPGDSAAKPPAPPEPSRTVDREVTFQMATPGTLLVDDVVLQRDAQGPRTFTLKSGKHRVRLDNPFYEPIEREVDIPETGSVERIVLKHDRFKPALLRVLADPGAQVLIDGEARGPAALSEESPFRVAMTTGDRRLDVKVVTQGKPDTVKTVIVRAGQTSEYDSRVK